MKPVIARAEVAPGKLPGGAGVVGLQRAGEFVLRFAKGHLSEQDAEELTGIMQGQVDAGTWTQNWAEPEGPAQHLKAS